MNQILSDVYLFTGWTPYGWYAALVLASLLDAITTIYALKKPGTREANPFMRRVMDKIGITPALALVKGLPLLSLFYGLQEHVLYVPLGVAVYVAAAGWNISVIRRGRA